MRDARNPAALAPLWVRAMLVTLDGLSLCDDPSVFAAQVEGLLLDHLGDDATCWFVDRDEQVLWSPRADVPDAALGTGLTGHVATTGEPLRTAMTARHPTHAPHVDGGVGRFMAACVHSRRETHAVLVVTRSARAPAFEQADEARLCQLADLLSPMLSRLALVLELQEMEPEPGVTAGLYRPEAAAEAMRHHSHGDLAHVASPWLTWCYRALVTLSIAALGLAAVVQVSEHAAGPALVTLGGRVEVAATRAGTVADILVAPGDVVRADQPLLVLHDAEAAAELARVELEFEQQLRRLLVDPADIAAASRVTSLRGQRLLARSRHGAQEVRAPDAGVVRDLRVSVGHPIDAGDVLLNVVGESTEAVLVAFLPGEHRPRVCPGMPLQLAVQGYPDAKVALAVDEVSESVVSPDEALRSLGPGRAQDLVLDGPVTVVRARLPRGSFQADQTRYPYHDGMRGRAEVQVRSASVLETLIPALHRLPLPRAADGDCSSVPSP